MIIIGITGTLGAGKGTVVKYLVENYGFLHFSVRDFITKEVKNRNLPVNRDTLTLIGNDLRKNHNPSYIVDCLYEEAQKEGLNCVIESIRTPGEIMSLRKHENFILLSIDADPMTRYKRIKIRNSETDQVQYETFIANEMREYDSYDPNKQNLGKCIEMADFHLTNNGTVEELYEQIEKLNLF
ncbi:MAG: AAA family ATPase [Bacteroidales bacterium]|jgi:dephospho-CoA kinase